MIHELRTPLTGLLGMTSLLRSTSLNPEQNDFTTTIESCGDSVLSLVGNLLDLSNLERNQTVLTSAPFSLIDCIEQALDIVSPQAAAMNIELLYELVSTALSSSSSSSSSGTPVVKGDVIRVRQVLLNLLTNAIKFTRKNGHVLVRLAMEPQDDDALSTLVTLEVVDDGIGIAQDALSRLFTVFAQADVTIAQRFGGSGLGLAIVKSLVELMKGTVRVQSTEGRGSTFSVTIPLLNSSSTTLTRESPMQHHRLAHITQHLTTKSAVVYLQDSLLAANLCKRLQALGVQNVATVDGSLLPFTPAHTDVIFCDELTYSVAKSASVCQLIKVDWQQRHNRTVTGNKDNCVFLRKPIHQQQLLDALSGVFNITPPPPLPPPPTITAKRPREQFPDGIHVRILVVDDNIVNRKAMQHMLEMIGCSKTSIYTASNGLEAILSLEQQMADIVLMDLEMPVMNGYDATRAIRKRWSLRTQLCIIAVTAAATEQTKQLCLQAGMNGFLSKPVRCAMLAETVQQAKIQRLSL